jgi:hypothetical protein
MAKRDDSSRGLSPLTIGLALGGSAAVWLLVEFARRLW